MSRLIEVTSLALTGGKRVKLGFSNGHHGKLDLTSMLAGFDEEFGMVRIEDGDLMWPSGAALKAEQLYLAATPYMSWKNRLAAFSDGWRRR